MGSPSISPIDSMVDWPDSHYQYVKNRILLINPNRKFGGIATASDWPSAEMIPEALYMILSTENPNRGDGPGTNPWSSPFYGMPIQWVWSIIGTDIPGTSAAANRGDRYRKTFVQMQEMVQGMYPGFCEKFNYSPNGTTLIATPYAPKEMIWFTKPRFSERIERTTGILFGSATTTITGIAPSISG